MIIRGNKPLVSRRKKKKNSMSNNKKQTTKKTPLPPQNPTFSTFFKNPPPPFQKKKEQEPHTEPGMTFHVVEGKHFLLHQSTSQIRIFTTLPLVLQDIVSN